MRIFLAEAWSFSVSFFCCAPPRRVWCLFFPGWLQISLSLGRHLSQPVLVCHVLQLPIFVVAICSRFDTSLRLGRQNCKPALRMWSHKRWIEGKNYFLWHAGYSLASAASMGLAFSALVSHCWVVFSFLSTGSPNSFKNSCSTATWTPVCTVAWSYFIPGARHCICLCWNTCPSISLVCRYPNEWQPRAPVYWQLPLTWWCSQPCWECIHSESHHSGC